MKHLFSLILVLCCGLSGFLFYKMNGGQEPIHGILFAIGLTGIVLSIRRQQKPPS